MIPTMVSVPTGSNSFSWQCEGWILHSLDLRHAISQTEFTVSEGGFPVMAETTRNHIFSKEISQVIIAAMVLAPNSY